MDALLLALQMTRRSLVYLIDNESVATGWRQRVWRERVPDGHVAPAGARQWMDSWKAVAEAARLDERVVHVISVESHTGWQELVAGLTSEQACTINDGADALANHAAKAVAPPAREARAILDRKRVALLVQRRIGAAVQLAAAA